MKKMKTISSDLIPSPVSAKDRELSRRVQDGRVAVITWMKLARKSSGQIACFLSQNGFEEPALTMVMESLAEDGYLDDAALAAKLIRQRQGKLLESHEALRHRLRQRGLSEESIQAAISDNGTDLLAAINLVSFRFGRMMTEANPLDDAAASLDRASRRRLLWQKAGRFLMNRGFDASTISIALRHYFPDIDSIDSFQA
jgi:SOS response regulatory protein OraA/RecX